MIKNAYLYEISNAPISKGQLIKQLDASPFIECSPSQAHSIGWLSPRGIPHGELVESVDGGRHWLMTIGIQKKSVPSGVIKKKVEKISADLERTQGRKPGKKEKRAIAEEVLHEMLPHAFPKDARILVWFDRETHLLTLGAGSVTQADECVSFLIKHIEGLSVQPLQTQISPVETMSQWLLDGEANGNLFLGKSCEMAACDEEKASVKYSRHSLNIDQIREHLQMGKLPTKIDLNLDDRVTFTLTSDFQIKKIKFGETPMKAEKGKKNEDEFDADAALMTGELVVLHTELIEAMGGRHHSIPSISPTRSQDDMPDFRFEAAEMA